MTSIVRKGRAIFALALAFSAAGAHSATLSVGPGKAYTTPCQALTRAVDGDTVEIAGGVTYSGDVCYFRVNNLTIKGVGVRPKIDAAGRNAAGKGTWVIGGANTVIENVEMFGAKVPDRNGAAIRQEGQHLTLRNVYIHHNEDGLLTSNDGVSNIVIENSEFGFNGYGTGYSHNVYVGKVASLVFTGNFSHDANVGHNLKSRARTNMIAYNRFSSSTGAPSYEIDLPNAGTSHLIGNVIQQPAAVNNPGIVSYGMEGATNPGKDLYVINNTFLNDRSSGGTYLLVHGSVTTPLIARNNLFVGTGTFSTQGSAIDHNNLKVVSYQFANRADFDLRPAAGTQAVDNGVNPGGEMTPTREYKHVASSAPRAVAGKLDIGAYESVAAAGEPTDVWARCAVEGGTCTVPGDKMVRYGANGKYTQRFVKGSVACTNAVFGDPIYGVVKACDYHNTPPSSWVTCATENGTCAVTGTQEVRYGAAGKYVYKTVTGSTACTNAAFGRDPIYGTVKDCAVEKD